MKFVSDHAAWKRGGIFSYSCMHESTAMLIFNFASLVSINVIMDGFSLVSVVRFPAPSPWLLTNFCVVNFLHACMTVHCCE